MEEIKESLKEYVERCSMPDVTKELLLKEIDEMSEDEIVEVTRDIVFKAVGYYVLYKCKDMDRSDINGLVVMATVMGILNRVLDNKLSDDEIIFFVVESLRGDIE